ncbi:MAG: aminomethyl-transferring glycine dehydrogenase subunit GcvPB [Actinomycetota bacterium]
MTLQASNTPAEQTLMERSRPGRRAAKMPSLDVPEIAADAIPANLLRLSPVALPELAERDLVTHYTRLSRRNYGIDLGFYPLGSCTMKYNPRLNEEVAAMPGFRRLHPLQPEEQVQGTLRLLVELEEALNEMTGMAAATFQPAAGAHGELTGLLLMRAFHAANGELDQRRKVIIPAAAHGTNTASVRLAGFETVEVPSDRRGLVDIAALEELVDDAVVGLMITNPNTLGLFEDNITKIASLIHGVGGLLYYDGANLNAIVGHCRPGDMGFDIVHMNLHKTFSTPHGGGGPGAGPIGVSERLIPFLPGPRPARNADGTFGWHPADELSIGRVHGTWGNIGVLVRAFTYIRTLGAEGLRGVSEMAVLNANYLLARLKERFDVAYDTQPLHEFVLTANRQKARGARAMDVAKRLIDHGMHPMTVYFPLVVEEAMMIEPTETESRETLDAFVEALFSIDREIDEDLDTVLGAPHTAPISRPDEATAARSPKVRW